MTTTYYGMQAFEHVHPLQGGLLRRKKRRERRATFKRENPATFFIRRVRDVLGTYPPACLITSDCTALTSWLVLSTSAG